GSRWHSTSTVPLRSGKTLAVPLTQDAHERHEPGSRGRPFRVRKAVAAAQFECGARGDLILRPTSGVLIMGYLHGRFDCVEIHTSAIRRLAPSRSQIVFSCAVTD